MGPQVESLARSNPRTRLLRIDIGDWNSPVARQYGINRLPSLQLYEGAELVDTDTGSIMRAIGG